MSNDEDFAYDDVDRAMIALLREDGRMTTSAMAKRLNVAEPTARRRLRRLLNEGGVRIRALLDPRRTVPNGALVSIRVQVDPPHLKSASIAICEMPESAAVSLTDGEYNLLMTAFFDSRETLVQFLSKKLGSVPGVGRVQVIDTLKILKLGQSWVPEYRDQVGELFPRKPWSETRRR